MLLVRFVVSLALSLHDISVPWINTQITSLEFKARTLRDYLLSSSLHLPAAKSSPKPSPLPHPSYANHPPPPVLGQAQSLLLSQILASHKCRANKPLSLPTTVDSDLSSQHLATPQPVPSIDQFSFDRSSCLQSTSNNTCCYV